MENCEEIIGSGLITYTEELKEESKTVKISNDNVLSGPSRPYQTYDVNIRSLGHTHATAEFVLLSEIITSYLISHIIHIIRSLVHTHDTVQFVLLSKINKVNSTNI